MNIIVIGAGFFGLYIAEHYAKAGHNVTIFDKEKCAMSRASYINQARVHNGYHYPRSVLTALRSRVSFPKFNKEFADCIESDFTKYYMTGKVLGKVTSKQFKQFCRHIGASCEPASSDIVDLVNPQLIDGVFKTKEYAFNSTKLKNVMLNRLDLMGVQIEYGTEVIKVEKPGSVLKVTVQSESETKIQESDQVLNCSYAMTNSMLGKSDIKLIPLKHEIAEMCLVNPPEIFNRIGITIMCGPFFSMMPFPAKKLHSFSHVRYTPHYEWLDDKQSYRQSYDILSEIDKKTAWKKMIYDARRYIPALGECTYKESIWEVKTVLPRSEASDSRPILFKKNHGLKGFHCVMGGKIDNVFDATTIINENGLI